MYAVITAFLNFRTSLFMGTFPSLKDDEKLRVWKGISQPWKVLSHQKVSVFFGGSNLNLTRTWSKIILTYYALWWLLYDLSRYCIEEKIWREHAPLLNMSSVVSNSSQPRHETKVMDDLVWMILFPKFDYPKKSRIIFLQSIGWVDLSYTFLLVRSIWSHSRLQKKIRITRKDSIEAALKLFW